MKKIFLLVVTVALLASCSAYQDAIKSDDIGLKYAMADSLYKLGKYKKSLKLWEQIVPVYRGRPQAERVQYQFADTYYQLGDYPQSGYQFERFVKSYPQSTKREEAAFKAAESYYQDSDRYYHDQGDTYKALEKLNEFLSSYPESAYTDNANTLVIELNDKLERKQLEIAKQYHKIAVSQFTYPAAIKALDNFILDNPGSKYREEAFYYKLDSAYKYAIGSVSRLVEERLRVAYDYNKAYNKYFPEGEYKEDVVAIQEDIEARLRAYEQQNEAK